jgi:hypothetical protein
VLVLAVLLIREEEGDAATIFVRILPLSGIGHSFSLQAQAAKGITTAVQVDQSKANVLERSVRWVSSDPFKKKRRRRRLQ